MGASLLSVTDLWRSYCRGSETIHAVAGVNLELAAGEVVALVGRSGSGKTTLLNQIGCLDRPTNGSLRLHGTEVTQLAESELAGFRQAHIGFIFQLFYLIPTLTVEENVALPLMFARRRDPARVTELMERVGIAKARRALPRQLSGGEMQRVAIARSMVNRPQLLLADEPTGRLDRKSRESIFGIFRELAADGLAIIVATHDPVMAGKADRTVELRDGRVVSETKNNNERKESV
jgi:putative ABC transport system ATP-binding protein